MSDPSAPRPGGPEGPEGLDPARRPRAEERLARRGGALELLRLPAALFGVVARARGALYDRRLLPQQRVDAPVVCVGNLTAGGTGKTPVVAWLVRRCLDHGLRPGILSRGYGARAQGGGPNDEARELARAFPDVPHVQDPDRVRGAQQLVEAGVDLIVLDDGYQHRRLARDLDLVLVDATRPWGLPAPAPGEPPVRALLPRGLLREPPEALRRADALIVTRTDSVPEAELERLEEELERLAPGTPRVRTRHAPSALETPEGPRSLDDLRGREVVLLSAIGNPAAFERTARELGAVVREHRVRPDHHAWIAADLAGLGDATPLTTGKDRPKLADLLPGVWTLEVAIEMLQGRGPLEALLDALPLARARRVRDALHEGLHG